jgi:DNA adenine methylase
MKPIIKWAGGKKDMLPLFQEIWETQSSDRLVEVFAGGLAIALGLELENVVANDINKDLISFYQFAQSGQVFPGEFVHSFKEYAAAKELYNTRVARGNTLTADDCARLFYYLSKTSFNGLYRVNARGIYNTPIGYPARYKSHPDKDTMSFNTQFSYSFPEFAKVTKNWTFNSVDFRRLEIKPSDLLFADPPYYGNYSQYSSTNFHWRDHVDLANWLDKHPGAIVATNSPHPEIIKLYLSKGFSYMLYNKTYSISGLAGGRRETCEAIFFRVSIARKARLPPLISYPVNQNGRRLTETEMSAEQWAEVQLLEELKANS